MKKITPVVIITLLLLSAVVCHAFNVNLYTDYGYLTIENSCGSKKVHVYANEEACTDAQWIEFTDDGSESLKLIMAYDDYDVDINNEFYIYSTECTYAVEAENEIAGGFQYKPGDTVTCSNKTTSLFWTECRCN